MRIIINPGTGPVQDTTEQNAITNIRHFITDIGKSVSFVRAPDFDYGDGRYAFLLWINNRCHAIQMPGLPLHSVRFTTGQDPWQFPRLYVDDASWLWEFAVNLCFNDEEE